MDVDEAQGGARRDRDRHDARHAGRLGKAADELPPTCSAAPRSSTTTRRSRSWSPRHSSRRARPPTWSASTMRASRARSIWRPRRKSRRSAGDSGEGSGAPPIDRGRRFRRRVRSSAGEARRDLHDARREPRDDGAARHHRGMERRQAHPLDLQPDDRLGQGQRLAKTLGIPSENVRLDLALHRRRLRRQAVRARGRGAGRARRRGGRTAGQGRAARAADRQQHHAPAGDDPAHPHRRDPRRQDHRHRARERVRQPARRQARDGGRPDQAALCAAPTA